MKQNLADEEAWALSDAIVQGTKRAVLECNFENYSKFFHIPFTMQTKFGEVIVDSDSQHQEIFARVLWQYRKKKITYSKRSLLTAQFFSTDDLLCVHESTLYSGTQIVQNSIKVLSTIKNINEEWVIVDSRYSVGNCVNLNRALYGPKFSMVQTTLKKSCNLIHIQASSEVRI